MPVQALTWPSRTPVKAALGRPVLRTSQVSPDTVAKAPSDELVAQLQAEVAKARQIGFTEGVKKGYEDAAKEINTANERLAQMLGDLAALKKKIRQEAEADVVKLSLAIARRILHRELECDKDSIHGLVYAGLQKLQNREISQVRVAPNSCEAVRIALEQAGAFPAITITPDPRIGAGGIVFETALGDLDASIETQLQEIGRGFADRLGIA